MKIYKLTDKINIKIDDIDVAISPLSTVQKAEVQALMMETLENPKNILPSMKAMNLCVKYAVKSIKGVEGLKFEDGCLTDDSVEALGNCKISNTLSRCCVNLLQGVPEYFTTEYGEKLDNVKIVETSKKIKKKKKD